MIFKNPQETKISYSNTVVSQEKFTVHWCHCVFLVCTICHPVCVSLKLELMVNLISYLCIHTSPNNYFPNGAGSFSLSPLFSDSLRLADAAPRRAWQVVSPCLFIPRCGLPLPRSVVQTHTLTYYYAHRQIQKGRSFRGRSRRDCLCLLRVIITHLMYLSAQQETAVCFCRKCTWGRRPSAPWTGSTSTARTSPEWRPLMPAEWASTARLWSCRPLRVR